jgi:hypothetical protein
MITKARSHHQKIIKAKRIGGGVAQEVEHHQVLVAHTYNPSYSEAEIRRIMVQRKPQANSS